jgi:hypothetical protein
MSDKMTKQNLKSRNMLSATNLVKQRVVLKTSSHISHVFIMQLNYLSNENLKSIHQVNYLTFPIINRYLKHRRQKIYLFLNTTICSLWKHKTTFSTTINNWKKDTSNLFLNIYIYIYIYIYIESEVALLKNSCGNMESALQPQEHQL